MRRMIRGGMACLLVMGTLMVTPTIAPETALAADVPLTECTEASFDAALAALQSSGGGALVFLCSGTISFTSQKEITSDVSIFGGGGVILDGGGNTRLFLVQSGARLALVGLALQNGSSTNTPGGAISNGGTLEITASTFSGNRAPFSSGGAILSGGTLEITASTFSDNRAVLGGAIDVYGTAEITASTFSGNRATGAAGFPGHGGAIRTEGTLTLTASTVVDNVASDGGGIRQSNSAGSTTLSASIVAQNAGGNCAGVGSFNSQGSNLSDDDSCNLIGPGDMPDSASINLGPLQDNGSLTQTLLPQTGSAAIDAADCALSSTQDQRGVVRPTSGVTCDIGAVELGTVPVQALALYGGGVEGNPADIIAFATGPAGASYSYAFDCDNDGGYETSGSDSGTTGTGACTFASSGTFTVGVEVCADGDCATATGDVIVANAAPSVGTLLLDPSPSVEGDVVDLTAGFNNPGTTASHTCEIDWGDGTVESGVVNEMNGSGTCAGSHTFADDAAYSITVTVDDSDGDSGVGSDIQTVDNVAPTIDAITTNGPVRQGQPVTVMVTARDPGVNDTLSYRFDCDSDGSYDVGPDTVDTATCALDPTAATTTISVLVEDDDGGRATAEVSVNQTAMLCANRYTGGLAAPAVNSACPSGTLTLSVPGPASTTLCISRYTGALTWSPRGTCGIGHRVHIVPDDGPLYYCQSLFTGQLRYAATGQCGQYERPGVIPG